MACSAFRFGPPLDQSRMVGNPYLYLITEALPVIRPERMLCKPDYNLDRVSGLHQSVHKPYMSVWTGSVFEQR